MALLLENPDANSMAEEPATEPATLPPAETPREVSWQAFLVPALIATAIIVLLFATSPNFRWTEGPDASPYAGDFLQEWVGGRVVREGDHSRFYDPRYARELEHDPAIVPQTWKRDEYLPLVYPPFYYVLVAPLSYLSLTSAAWVWAALTTSWLCGALAILVTSSGTLRPPLGETRWPDDTATFTAWLPWLLPAAVLFAPVLESLASSQKGTLCLLVMTATLALLRHQRPLEAGMAFGLLVFKPQLGIVVGVAMLFRGEWKFAVGSAITVAAAAGISLALGFDVCRQYLDFLRHGANYMSTPGYDLAKAHTWLGFFALLTGEPTGLATRVLSIGALLGTMGLLAWMFRETPRLDSPQFARQFAALVVATILVSPHFFTYDLTILLLPLTVVGMQLATTKPEDRPAWTWLLPLLYVAPALSVSLASSFGLQISVPLMAALLACLALETPSIELPNGEIARGKPAAL